MHDNEPRNECNTHIVSLPNCRRKTLAECADIQKGLSRELLNHELDIEKQCLGALTSILETDIPNVLKSRKQLNKATQDMDNYRQRYQAALKASHQSNGPAATVAAANKAEAVKKEWEEASTKVDQTKVCQAINLDRNVNRHPRAPLNVSILAFHSSHLFPSLFTPSSPVATLTNPSLSTISGYFRG